VRLKGRVAPADVAAAADIPEDEATSSLSSLAEAGLLKEANGRYMLDAAGRERQDELLDAERPGLDAEALTSAYEEFDGLNTELKQIMHAWQLRDGEPNDHSDAAYDQQAVDRLVALNETMKPLTAKIVAAAPRLAPYAGRFDSAIEKVQAGDHSWIARPIADSYHTVWFELHEELIGALGLSREEEAASGRAE
jgi:hypothetical protein